ncbi:MAG: formyltransferase family protein [Bacteroidetes bacterium]|nr:formyltransferase family protein [Bacteroidota bacterium]
MKNIILFASGNGSNAENICKYFQNHSQIKVVALICNKEGAGVFERVKPYGIPTHLVSKKQLQDEQYFLNLIAPYNADLLVLAGWLLLVPHYLVNHYEQKIVNVHPSLLPKFGGKGMYGHHVHEAVKEANESETGISIHWVNQHFDEGEIIYQAKTQLSAEDNVEDIAKKIAVLEMANFPKVIESILTRNGS